MVYRMQRPIMNKVINCLLFVNAHTGVVYTEQEKQYLK